jgi:hypothetical protein
VAESIYVSSPNGGFSFRLDPLISNRPRALFPDGRKERIEGEEDTSKKPLQQGLYLVLDGLRLAVSLMEDGNWERLVYSGPHHREWGIDRAWSLARKYGLLPAVGFCPEANTVKGPFTRQEIEAVESNILSPSGAGLASDIRSKGIVIEAKGSWRCPTTGTFCDAPFELEEALTPGAYLRLRDILDITPSI